MNNEDLINIISEKLTDSFYSAESETDVDNLFKILLYEVSVGNDVADLYNLLGMDNFCKLVEFFNGKKIRTIRKEKLNEIMRTAILFYEFEINGLDWKEIKKLYPDTKIDVNAERFRIKKLKETLRKQVSSTVFGEKEN